MLTESRTIGRDAIPEGALPSGTPGRILQVALARFARDGFAGTSIRHIAGDAGINSATLYAHFASKEEILRALIMIGHTELDRRVRDAADAAGADPIERFAAIIAADVIAHATHPMLAVVINTELRSLSEEAAAAAYAIRRSLLELAIATVHDGITTGRFHTSDPTLAMRAISDMVKSVGQWFSPGEQDAEALAARYVSFALRIVDAEDAPPHPNPDHGQELR